MSNTVRIFISSPADVGYERARAERVAERLSGLIDGLTVETYRWEKGRYFSAHTDFQTQIMPVESFDIVVGLFWSRVGSPLPPDFPRMGDGRPYPSGTAFEVLRAIEHRRESGAALPDVLVYRKTAPLPVSVEQDKERAAQSAALDTLDAFMAEWFVNPRDGFKAAFHSFKHADEFEQIFEMHLRAWLRENRRLGRERVWRVEERGSPFRGLKPFEPEHRDAFFGRRADIERARERLEDAAASGCGFLLIEGASGTGKSSLARAGLLPRQSDLDPDLRTAIMVPRGDPVKDLALALFTSPAVPELSTGDYDTPDRLADHLARGGDVVPILRALDRAATALAERDGRKNAPDLQLVLLVDQLENVFLNSVSAAARTGFCDALVGLARSGRVRVIATLRADGRAAALSEPALARLIDDGAGLALAPPGPEALSEIVRGPAEAAGLAFSRRAEDGLGLDEILIRDAGGADALPLLQFVLDELYEAAVARMRAAGRRLGEVADDEPVALLDLADYRGLEGAVETKADEAFTSVSVKAQAALPRLVRTLTEPGPGGVPVLRAATVGDAAPGPEGGALVTALVDARILVRDGETLRFSHETALRGWRRAAATAAEAATFLRIRADVARQQDRWIEGGRHRSLLIPPGVRLAEADAIQKAHGEELAPYAHFVDRSRRRARLGQTLTGAAAVLFAGVAIAALVFFQRSERATAQALAEAARAEAGEAAAEAALREATEAANTLVFDLAGEFANRGLPLALRRTILDRAQALQDSLLASAEGDAELMQSYAMALSAVGDLEFRELHYEAAIRAHSEAAAVLQELFKVQEGDTLLAYHLASVLTSLGRAQSTLGDTAAAAITYENVVKIYEELQAVEPDNENWMRGTALLKSQISEIKQKNGDLLGALNLLLESMETMRALVWLFPDNHEYRGSLASTLHKIAGLQLSLGKAQEALTIAEEGLFLFRYLAVLDSGNIRWSVGVAELLRLIGNMHRANGELVIALNMHSEGASLSRWIADKDSGDPTRQILLAAILLDSAITLAAKQDHKAALLNYYEALSIFRNLATQETEVFAASKSLLFILKEIGHIHLLEFQPDRALAAYSEGLGLARNLAERAPNGEISPSTISEFLEAIGNFHLTEQNVEEALIYLSEALQIHRSLAEDAPNDGNLLKTILRVHVSMLEGLVSREPHDRERIATLATEALGVAQAMESLGILEPELTAIIPTLAETIEIFR